MCRALYGGGVVALNTQCGWQSGLPGAWHQCWAFARRGVARVRPWSTCPHLGCCRNMPYVEVNEGRNPFPCMRYGVNDGMRRRGG